VCVHEKTTDLLLTSESED